MSPEAVFESRDPADPSSESNPRSGLSIQAELATRRVRYNLEVPAGQVVAVLGPNGAGKSTLLDLIAGVLAPSAGSILLNDRVLADARAGRSVPPHRRRIALLAQRPLLFPHMSVRDNVAFGPRSVGAGRRQARARADQWLDVVAMADFADRKPATLSGGQAQRVAIGRALAAEPAALLLDEPMGALDIDAAPQVRALLRTVLRSEQRCAVIVTHNPIDALLLADRVAVIEAGRIVQRGSVREVFDAPRSAFLARMMGANLIEGVIEEPGVLRTPSGLRVSGAGTAPVGSAAVAVFDAVAVAVHLEAGRGSERNAFAATVVGIEPRDSAMRVTADINGHTLRADITPAALVDLHPEPGDPVTLVVKAQQVRLLAI